MSVITNDGWWGETPGYRQHLSYSRLRAIETRRSIARSANTGISALINQRGDYLQKSTWWTKDYLRGEININNKLTFYVRYGDYIGRIASYMLALLLLYWLLLFIPKQKKS
jgi:apolipoprotein N-acyltransferase